MMKRTLLLAGMICVVPMSHAVMLFDDFGSGVYSVSIQSGSDTAHQNGGMIGGKRRTFVQVQSNPLNQYLDFSVGNGFSITSSGALLDGYTEIGYGDTAQLNANLSAENAVEVNFRSSDLPMQMRLTLSSVTSGQTETVTTNVAAGTNFVHVVPFALFTTFSAFGDVDEIRVAFESVTNGDFVIDGIKAVPEPISLSALGIGAAAWALRRRRRK